MIDSLLKYFAILCVSLALAPVVRAQAPFRVGDFPSWQLSAAPGSQNPDNSISVTGNGQDCNYWLSKHVDLIPGSVYKYKVSARKLSGAGCVVTGPLFCNVDVAGLTEDWSTVENIFAPLYSMSDSRSAIRLGQWHLNGTVEFRDFSIVQVIPVYSESQGVVLGSDERISVNEYIFAPLFSSVNRNHSRPLFLNNASFNTHRWVFWQGNSVVYRFSVNGRRQLRARVAVTVNYHKSGRMVVEASRDNETWLPVAEADKVSSVEASLPDALFPADVVYLRISADSRHNTGAKDSDPGAFQVNNFSYRASLTGTPTEIVGATRYIEVLQNDPKLDVTVLGMGEALPGGRNAFELKVANRTDRAIPLAPQVVVGNSKGYSKAYPGATATLAAGQSMTLSLPYDFKDTGKWRARVVLGGNSPYTIATDCLISDFFNTSYGGILAPSDGTATVWQASSEWKVPRRRKLPTATARGIAISAARNEAEATQLVITPERDIVDLQAAASKFQAADGRILPADIVEILRVYYHDVKIRTDATGIIGLWPDALPPLRKGLVFPAGENQPLWVRVTVPANAAAGQYKGAIYLRDAKGWRKEIPVVLNVYDFDMPADMTCETAFGLYPHFLWKYHKASGEKDKRAILDSYLTTLSKHHISPYNPAPLDPWTAELKGAENSWENLVTVADQPEAGNQAAVVTDTSTRGDTALDLRKLLPVGKAGLTVRFRYKTATPNHEFMVTAGSYDENRRWIYGRNKDRRIQGDGTWQSCTLKLDRFAPEARYTKLCFRPDVWTLKGELTGTVMYADIEVVDIATGEVLVAKDSFFKRDYRNYEIVFNWENWDRAVERAFNHYHFCALRFNMGGLGGGTFHSRQEPSLFGFREGTPEYDFLLKKYMNGIQDHLAARGWLRRAYVYWFDEPDPKDYEFVMNGFRKVKEHAPGLRRLLTEQVEPELVGGPNLWCPISNNTLRADIEARQAAGEEFWWYVCTGPKAPYCTLFIDHPGIEMRVWLWQTWNLGLTGILVWCANLWSSEAAYPDSLQNPYLDPMGWVTGYDLPKGTRRAWGNGDGRFLYPPEAAADGTQSGTVLDKPVDSIRLEMLRDGLEDYEYFAMLKRLVARKARALSVQEKAGYEALLKVPEAVSKSPTEFAVNPDALEAHREKLARAIEALTKR